MADDAKSDTKTDTKTDTATTTPEFLQAEPKELDKASLVGVTGGRMTETKWTYCGQGGPTECYKPNPY